MSGVADPVARNEEEKEISLRELERTLAAASTAADDAWARMRERWFDRLLGSGRDDVPAAFHSAYMRRLSPLESTYTKERAVEVCMATLSNLGFDMENDENIRLDLDDRPQKSPRACVIASDPPKVVHLITRAMGGLHTLCHLAGQLGVLGLPVFLFHEGHEPIAAATFRADGEAFRRRLLPLRCRQRPGGFNQLLRAVAVYAAGGLKALQDLGQRAGGKTLLLTRQLGAKSGHAGLFRPRLYRPGRHHLSAAGLEPRRSGAAGDHAALCGDRRGAGRPGPARRRRQDRPGVDGSEPGISAIWRRWQARRQLAGIGQPQGHRSGVDTAYLSVSLDHDTGSVDGQVKQGRFGGRRLGELSRADLLLLLDEVRREDHEAVAVLEAYLDEFMDRSGVAKATRADRSRGGLRRERPAALCRGRRRSPCSG